ncbi:MAG TPA: nicotinate-nucleotide adenylyltransferase [Candidatus Limnocylindrales bacterium]|nr:nicotinate-nucleotide adenylyltransferase [Candidatus Limnocylindrales bacterium]
MSERWGILGGIFDPIHYGHLTVAEQTRDALALDTVLFIPTGIPVHKHAPDASAEDRARMVEIATADNPAFQVSRIELDSDRPNYTVDTLQALTDETPAREFTLIVSSETASYMPEWHLPERILQLARVAIVSRLGYADISLEWISHHFPEQADRFVRVATSHLGHSSTDIRDRVAGGRPIRYLVPAAVEAYIGDNHLYGYGQ